MSVKVMTSKDLHIAVKRPDGISYLMNRFQFADEEAMFIAIRRVSPEHGERFVKELLKTRRKQKSPTATESPKSEDAWVIPIIDKEPIQTEEIKDVKEEDKSVRLEDLQKEEQELSSTLCSLEGIHKELVSKRRDIVSSFVAEKGYLIKLQKELKKHEQIVKKLYGEYDDCLARMHELNEDMRVYESLLSELRMQIESLKKVIVLVYDTGLIEVENAEIPVVSDAAVKREFDRLISLPQAEEVTIKSVKAVAKLRAMLTHLPSDVELIFDSAEAQALYEAA